MISGFEGPVCGEVKVVGEGGFDREGEGFFCEGGGEGFSYEGGGKFIVQIFNCGGEESFKFKSLN